MEHCYEKQEGLKMLASHCMYVTDGSTYKSGVGDMEGAGHLVALPVGVLGVVAPSISFVISIQEGV